MQVKNSYLKLPNDGGVELYMANPKMTTHTKTKLTSRRSRDPSNQRATPKDSADKVICKGMLSKRGVRGAMKMAQARSVWQNME